MPTSLTPSQMTATIKTLTMVPSRAPSLVTTAPTISATKIRDLTEAPEPTSQLIEPDGNMLVFGNLLWQVPVPDRIIELPVNVGGQPWSPNGASLVGWDRKNQSLSIFNIESRLITPLSTTANSYSGAFWSPDGRFLLGSVPDPTGYTYTVVIYDFKARQETVLAEDVYLLSLAGWSYDSSEIAFAHVIGNEEDEFMTALETIVVESKINQTTILPSTMVEGASWSPTEKQLLIYASPDLSVYNPALPVYFHRQLFLMDVDTGNAKQLLGDADASTEYWIHDSPWSPAGERIVYSNSGAICSLHLVNEEEVCFEVLNEVIGNAGAGAGWYPSWSADGEWLAFVLHYENQQCNPVAVAKTDGSSFIFTDVKVGHCSVFGPVWQPNTKPDD